MWNRSTTATGEKTSMKDDVRKENEQLCIELDNLGREHKKLKQIVDQLSTDYEESKAYDPLRRYEKLKGMVKRTIMHLKLNPDEPNTIQAGVVGGLMQGCRDISHQAESARRREDKYSKMSRQELQQENVHLQTQVREMRRKCAIIRDVIDNLQKHFNASKRHPAIQRYNMLKAMVKTVIHDELI
ncbi:uncharacterized protein LOC127867988 [Dreissena polymorpha]|uniref:Uncharacterized protein n=1 Tax=Dreissena polymorpha TaxID=45954 RepID=A0A9D4RKA3_DREPO|nr:uncharacterized protein LOC127865305 isoform X2 [Dreissena polymorpha]XP_052265492.1 uncharacterized protein LOC127867988 [Dreissena polymorpha]KAH3869310.1 hypothetical protein DPMN_032473 [Dreissena polymorpha]KAH3876681.1 hypothetical protein DPMN_000529 [Dreissena polymorpha]